LQSLAIVSAAAAAVGRWVHCVGRTTLKVSPGDRLHRKLLGGLYSFLAANSRHVTAAWGIPTSHLIELGMDVEV
jgi:hypothetical protein